MTAAPLDIDLNTVDTSMPLIADNSIVDLLIDKVTKKDTSTPGVQMLSLDMKTTGPSKAQDGADLGAGVHVFHNINLAPSGKATWEMVGRNIATLTQAAGIVIPGTGFNEQLTQLTDNFVAILQGQTVRAKLAVKPAGTNPKNGKSFNAKNEVSVFMKVS